MVWPWCYMMHGTVNLETVTDGKHPQVYLYHNDKMENKVLGWEDSSVCKSTCHANLMTAWVWFPEAPKLDAVCGMHGSGDREAGTDRKTIWTHGRQNQERGDSGAGLRSFSEGPSSVPCYRLRGRGMNRENRQCFVIFETGHSVYPWLH